MQDHAYEIRQQYINDYAARVRLAPEAQRSLWIDHLKAIRHPRMEPITRRETVQGLGKETASTLRQARAIHEALSNAEKDRAMREAWKEI